jgi:iron complex transport system substrate-binding protein
MQFHKSVCVREVALVLCLFFLVGPAMSEGVQEGSGSAASGPKTVAVYDEEDREVVAPSPPERIIVLSHYMATVVGAFDMVEYTVGRTDQSIFPPSMQDVTIVSESMSRPNVELLLEQRPDFIIGNPSLKPEQREVLDKAYIPYYLAKGYDLDSIEATVEDLGVVFDDKERANQLLSFIREYRSVVERRLEGVPESDKPRVFYEHAAGSYQTLSKGSSSHLRLVYAGAYNVAQDETDNAPKVSAEWVMEKNPEIILRQFSPVRLSLPLDVEMTEEVLKPVRDEIMNRPGLGETDAVKKGQVYLIGNKIWAGLRSLIGQVYMAKLFHPDLFDDLNPREIHREMLDRFFGLPLEGTWLYPEISD